MTKRNNTGGFTLVELLVVMVIMGLGFISLSPSLAEKTVKGGGDESFFNELIQSQLKAAKDLNRQVFIKGTVGTADLLLSDGTTATIPVGKVDSVKINDKNINGVEYYIYFYPDGIFDDFEMEISDGKVVQSYPMLATAVVK
jgi:prepilin-type N-terminal cleavage/methylation domain-containing protein